MNMITTETGDPVPIKAIPLRRPGRWIAAVVVVLFGLFVYGAATNEAGMGDLRSVSVRQTHLRWCVDNDPADGAGNGDRDRPRCDSGSRPTLSQPGASRRSRGYLWIFRGTPVYVQLVFWGLFPSIYKSIDLGIPFVHQFAHINLQDLQAAFLFAVIGLALNEAAYMAEIVRAGVSSVNEGQTEASVALGMTASQTMRRTVLPQAMRVIIPPTGNGSSACSRPPRS